jgi:gag-polyprotein putative aspartyl protease
MKLLLFFAVLFLNATKVKAQFDYVYSKDFKIIFTKKAIMNDCLSRLDKTSADKAAVAFCECQADKINYKFTNKQYKKYTKNRVIDIAALLNEDSVVKKELEECFLNSGKAIQLSLGSYQGYIKGCISNIYASTKKKLDSNNVVKYCYCTIELLKTKKISEAQMESLSNPNSILFYEIMYKCGSPYSDEDSKYRNWSASNVADIIGPLQDTIAILNLNGMTYVRIKIGSTIQFWLYDTGATDLLINTEMESILKKEGILTETNYKGIKEYEMANGAVDSCKQYMVNNVIIGKFSINNVSIAVSDKGKKVIVGKSLLNKFSFCLLDNKKDILILSK